MKLFQKAVMLLMLLNTGWLYAQQDPAVSPVRIPAVTGPITGPGNLFGASTVDLSPYGYIEEEYFMEGQARRYDFNTNPGSAIAVDTLYPYKTRIIVRRPADPVKFNGTVAVEWLNVSSMLDLDADWYYLHEHFMRSGYVWVGVSAQKDGIHSLTGLRKWNPGRYGSLDVTVDSALIQDQLCFDIYSQAFMALKSAQEVNPLGNLRPEAFIATGHSQSALFLTGYYNMIQPHNNIIDGFMIVGAGWKLRTDIPAKVFKLNTETDLILLEQVASRQPDNDHMATWEFAGTSHADRRFLDCYGATMKRDLGSFTPPECDLPLCSEIPFYYGLTAAMEHMNRWIREDIAPPHGIQIAVLKSSPPVILDRDSLGNALGGIRLPQFDVPIAINTGVNDGQNWFCQFYGTHKPFDRHTLKSLYPTHQAYMQKFSESVQKNLKAGYILEADKTAILNEAGKLAFLWEQ